MAGLHVIQEGHQMLNVDRDFLGNEAFFLRMPSGFLTFSDSVMMIWVELEPGRPKKV